MTIIAINLTLIEMIVLPLAAVIFGVTLYFFIKSRKNLQDTLKANRKNFALNPRPEKLQTPVSGHTPVFHERVARNVPDHLSQEKSGIFKKKAQDEHTVMDLKQTIAQQQKMLDTYLHKVEELENEGRLELNKTIKGLEKKVDELYAVIERKDEELKEVTQQAVAGERMAARIEEVYREFDQLQAKMEHLEKQAGRANNLAIELEDTRYSYEQVHKELLRKQEKLEQLSEESQQMRFDMDELQDKLAEANLQRQQLQKKVQFLTELNNDMQGISDTNKKLKSELRRIGELESMLNIMSEEREYLLKKRKDK